MKNIFISITFVFVFALCISVEILVLSYIKPDIVAKYEKDTGKYSMVDNPKNFKFECFWDFSTSLFPSRVCTYEPIKKD